MKNVLVIAYYFPPLGGGGVQRTAKHVKYLSECGYHPVVLTVDPRFVRKVKDPGLLRDIPEDVPVYRTFTLDADWLFKIFYGLGMIGFVRWMIRYLFVPDIQKLWTPFAIGKLKKIIKRHSIDLVYVSGTPFSSFKIGQYMKKRCRIPLVLDFRDEWTYHPEYLDFPPPRAIQRIERCMEKKALLDCDAVVNLTIQMRDNFLKRYPFLKDKSMRIMPNGYDEQDFAAVEPAKREKALMRLVFAGTLYGKRRNAEILLSAARTLFAEGATDFRIDIYGKNTASNILKPGDERFTKICGYVSHDQIIREILSADLLLIIINPGPNCESEYTGKLFEYIRTGNPILAIAPTNGAAAGVIRETETGFVADSTDPQAVLEALRNCYNQWKAGSLEVNPNREAVRRYERKALTERLAGLFDELTDKGADNGAKR